MKEETHPYLLFTVLGISEKNPQEMVPIGITALSVTSLLWLMPDDNLICSYLKVTHRPDLNEGVRKLCAYAV